MDPLALARGLVGLAADGSLPAPDVWPALRRCLGDGPVASGAGLLEALHDDPRLAPRLRQVRRRDVLERRRFLLARAPLPEELGAATADLPAPASLDWPRETDARPFIGKAMALLEDRRAVAPRRDRAPQLAARIDAALGEAAAAAVRAASDPSRAEADALAGLFDAAPSREEKRALLDRAALWPVDSSAASLASMVREPWAAERAGLNLVLRLGDEVPEDPEQFRRWIEERAGRNADLRRRPEGFALLEAVAAGDLEAAARIEATLPSPGTSLERVLSRWRKEVAPLERAALLGLEFKPPPPPAPPKPSVWDVHIRPVVAANWTLVAGVAMVLVGATLLGYYTWDKHWLLRYTIMPGLFAAFTAGLAGAGGWMERRDAAFKETAAFLRGAAVALLPVNFMAVALLARDPQVTARPAAVGVMSLFYLLLAGWGLRRWCGPALGATLLALDGLVMLGPLAETFAGSSPPVVAGAGFYAGFLALAWSLRRETRRFAFAGLTLGLTFLQVFAWVHGYLGRFPDPHAYAPLVVLAGGLVLDLERRRPREGAESFLGFAFILLGLLLGAGSPTSRLASFLLAGLVWLPSGRRHPAHAWIAFSLLLLGVASIALLPGFPPVWIPALGLGAAAALAAVRHPAARGLEPAVLGVTVVAAAFVQWAWRTPPLATAAWMAGVAALFLARPDPRRVFAAAAVFAAALPFAGCVDVANRTLYGNTLTFGLASLAWAWIAAARLPAVREARSAILWLYGGLAIGAMLAGRPPGDGVLGARDLAALGGPVLMSGALAVAAIWSRSLVPGAMAAALLAVLAPAMRSELHALFPQLRWGSGLGSAIWALVLAAAAFPLRRFSFAGEGDRFLGLAPFPFRRHDHTLVTWPLLGAVLFLAFKVDLWNVARNLGPDGLPLRTAIAVFLTGATWLLVAAWSGRRAFSLLGAACLTAGIATAWTTGHWTQIVLASWLLLRAIQLATRSVPAVSEPLALLLCWSGPGLAVALIGALASGTGCREMIPLVLVAGVELLAAKQLVHGTAWAVLAWAAVVEWLGAGWRAFPQGAFDPTLGFVLAAIWVRRPRFLGEPLKWVSTVLAALLLIAAPGELPTRQALGALAAMLAARATGLGPLALGAAAIGWLSMRGGREVLELLEPKSMAVFGAGLVVLAELGRRWPVLLPKPLHAWLAWPGMGLAAIAAVVHTAGFRGEPEHLWAPYLAAAVFALGRQGGAAIAFAALANVHAVRLTIGPWLLERGLSEIHLAAIGLGVSSAIAALFKRKEALAGAALVLALLAVNYVAHPDLQEVTALRFAVSGAMALVAALVFRRERELRFLYDAGVTVALWCWALAVPALRTPAGALVALGVPALYFWGRAERDRAYRTSAAAVAFLVLAVYAARPLFQLVLFPEAPFETSFYHRNSPVGFALALILLRLHALGATSWTAFYGGLALMASAHFAVTALPGLSPFAHPAAGAWAAVAMAHFWTAASGGPSPLRAAIQKLSALDDDAWSRLRNLWGWSLAVACLGSVAWGLSERDKQVLPLLLGGASVLIHQGILRRSRPWIEAGAALALLGLHAGFVVPSLLPKEAVVWVLLGLWAAALVARLPGREGAIAAALTFGHVLWHGPGSTSGLAAFAIGAVLAAATPGGPRGVAALLLVAPAWLAFFGARDWTGAALLATALALRVPFRVPASRLLACVPAGPAARATLLGGASIAAWAGEPLLSLAVQAGLAWAWWTEGREKKSTAFVALAEVAVLGAFLAGRAQLASMGAWRPDFDVWASLVAFGALAGIRPGLEQAPAEVRRPLLATLLLLPLFTVAWVVWRELGRDLLLIVLGLHGVLFAAAGRDRKDSPYHGAATLSFTAFVLVLFWARLELRVAAAYVIPVGAGVLALLRIFGKSIDPAARNAVRLATMLAMVGSAGYHALMDERYPLAFHATLMLLGLFAMGLGTLLQIRVHVLLGFGAVLTDLAAILVKGLAHMERGARMTALGCGVLGLGALLVAGAVFVKVRRAEVDAALDRWRLKLSSWE